MELLEVVKVALQVFEGEPHYCLVLEQCHQQLFEHYFSITGVVS